MHQLRSLTLHVEQELDDGWIDVFLNSFTDALSCMQALGCEGMLERLEIHVHLSTLSRLPVREDEYDNRPALLAVALSRQHIRDLCRKLEQALLAHGSEQPPFNRSTRLALIMHLPPSWIPRQVVLRTLNEYNFPELSRRGLLYTGYSSGKPISLLHDSMSAQSSSID